VCIIAQDKCNVKAQDTCDVKAQDTCDVKAQDTCDVKAQDTCDVKAQDACDVKAQDTCDVKAQDTRYVHHYRSTIAQHTATHCNMLHYSATHSDTQQHKPMHQNTTDMPQTCRKLVSWHDTCTRAQGTRLVYYCITHVNHTATRCITLQHTATHCNTLQHTAMYCNTDLCVMTPHMSITMQHTAPRCTTLQHRLAYHETTHVNQSVLCLLSRTSQSPSALFQNAGSGRGPLAPRCRSGLVTTKPGRFFKFAKILAAQ